MIHPVDANQPLVGSPSATITGSFVLTQHELPLIKVCVATSAEGSLPPEVINTEPSIWHHTWGDHSGTWWQVDYFVFHSEKGNDLALLVLLSTPDMDFPCLSSMPQPYEGSQNSLFVGIVSCTIVSDWCTQFMAKEFQKWTHNHRFLGFLMYPIILDSLNPRYLWIWM